MQTDSELTALLRTRSPADDEQVFQRLATLSPVEYDRVRDDESKSLGIRVATLDMEVARRRPTNEDTTAQGHAVVLPDVEPWPESVDGPEILNDVAQTIGKYVVLPEGASDAIALWTAHTHCYNRFQHSPRLNCTSPDKGSGKTLLLDVIGSVVPKPLRTESITAAVLFRLVESCSPTLLLDEVDAYLNEAEELRGLLNAGHKRGARAYRCEGESNEVRGFNAFAPAALAGIGNLPGTLHDRSIVIRLVRAKPGEIKARFDSRHIEHEQELCRKVARWTADHIVQIEGADPALPDGAFNRLADNWRPLFAVAEVAGGDWPDRARRAFVLLTASEDQDAQGIGSMLLADIRAAFSNAGTDRLFSRALVESLLAMSDRPWGEIRKGKEITENWLAHRLRGFGVSPKTLRIDADRAKGYELQDLAEAFERYLADTPVSSRDTVTTPVSTGAKSHSQVVTSEGPVTVQEPHETLADTELSRCHGSTLPTVEAPADELLV